MKSQQSHFLDTFDQVQNIKKNHLYYGDNLTIMRNMPNACVDLIYLDPPFNSQRNYNLIYKKLTGQPIPEQEEAFCDAWEMDAEKEELVRRMPIAFEEYGANADLVLFWQTWIKALRYTQPSLLAYLIYMTYRLFEMRRILKPSGSIYLHCDPTASHYIKVIMDGVFGHNNFRNEIVWKRTGAHNSGKKFGPVHDVILFYSKGSEYTWNQQYQAQDEYIAQRYTYVDDKQRKFYPVSLIAAGTRNGASGLPWRGIDVTAKGNHWRYKVEKLELLDKAGDIYWPPKGGLPRLKMYAENAKGALVQDWWDGIPPLNSQAAERLGYPTQKPIKLLSRIIQASSNEGDVIFDPFAGCGTSIYAAHLLGRKWIGCDIAILSVKLVRDVLLKRYGLQEGEHYDINGIPVSVEGAQDLFSRDPHQFQHWSVELAGGFASTKKSGDLGIDGRIYFETTSGLKNMVISVKGGKLTPAYVRELRGVIEREGATELGGFICLDKPTKGMISEAAAAGTFNYLGKEYPRLQIRSIEDLLTGKGFETPSKVQTLSWIKHLQIALPNM
ncbi:MAG: DNA methyltransferase [Chloroflexota bacterium]|nr:DNA methyltransferase [Chloroflexota bacterium]